MAESRTHRRVIEQGFDVPQRITLAEEDLDENDSDHKLLAQEITKLKEEIAKGMNSMNARLTALVGSAAVSVLLLALNIVINRG